MLLLLVSFIGGVLTVLAPCILPLLPVVVGGSLADGRVNVRKALTVVGALGLSVILFTLLLKVSTALITIPEYVWRWLSGGIVLLFGLVTLFPTLWENHWLARLNARSNLLLGRGDSQQNWWGDVIVGAALGPVFSTCSPTYFLVLATVLPVRPILGLLYLFAYTIGLCLSLLLIAFVGQRIMTKLDLAADPRGWFKRALGLLFLLVGLAILTGGDKRAETWLTGAGFFDVTKVEQGLLERLPDGRLPTTSVLPAAPLGALDPGALATTTPTPPPASQPSVKAKSSPLAAILNQALIKIPAPEIARPSGFINTNQAPLTLAGLRGQVVLVDFWTYSCINCQRTLPYLKDWYDKYHNQGLEIVGIHTPEFAFERLQANVAKAVQDFGIKYPVVLDNDYATWAAFGNRYWPRKYLIDPDGNIIYDHIGEGGYDETEQQIQSALARRQASLGLAVPAGALTTTTVAPPPAEPSLARSPETYFGSARNTNLGNGRSGRVGEQTLQLPDQREPNLLYLSGTWQFAPEFAQNLGQGSVVFRYQAKSVYLVAGSEQGVVAQVFLDGKLLKSLTIQANQLYHLVDGESDGEHELELRLPTAGLQAFTFTFG